MGSRDRICGAHWVHEPRRPFVCSPGFSRFGSLSSVNRDHEPRRVWSPGFSRLRSLRRTGPAKAGTPNKFMESLDLQLWTRIGTMNRHSAVRCPRFSVSSRFGHPKGWTPNTRFMESHDAVLARIGTTNHEGKTSNVEHRTPKTPGF